MHFCKHGHWYDTCDQKCQLLHLGQFLGNIMGQVCDNFLWDRASECSDL